MRYSSFLPTYVSYVDEFSDKGRDELLRNVIGEYFKFRDFDLYGKWLKGSSHYSYFLLALSVEISRSKLEIPHSHLTSFLETFYEFLIGYKYLKLEQKTSKQKIDININELNNMIKYVSLISNSRYRNLEKIQLILNRLLDIKKRMLGNGEIDDDPPRVEEANTSGVETAKVASLNLYRAKKSELIMLSSEYKKLRDDQKEQVVINMIKRFPKEIGNLDIPLSKQFCVDAFHCFYKNKEISMFEKAEDSILSFFSMILKRVGNLDISVHEFGFSRIDDFIEHVHSFYKRSIAYHPDNDLLLDAIYEEIVYALFRHTKYCTPYQNLIAKYAKKINAYFDKIKSEKVSVSDLDGVLKQIDFETTLPETLLYSLPKHRIEKDKFVFKPLSGKLAVKLKRGQRSNSPFSLLDSFVFLYETIVRPNLGLVNQIQGGPYSYPNFIPNTYIIKKIQEHDEINKFIDNGNRLYLDIDFSNSLRIGNGGKEGHILKGLEMPIYTLITAMVNSKTAVYSDSEIKAFDKFFRNEREYLEGRYYEKSGMTYMKFLCSNIDKVLTFYDFSDETSILQLFNTYPVFSKKLTEMFSADREINNNEKSIKMGIYNEYATEYMRIGYSILKKLEEHQSEVINAIKQFFDWNMDIEGRELNDLIVKPVMEYYVSISNA